MNLKHAVTRINYNNDPKAPVTLQVKWEPDEDGRGWAGHCTFYSMRAEGDERVVASGYSVHIGQTIPLGSIYVNLDRHVSETFDGTGLTERDLYWATVWAATAIKNKRMCNNEPTIDTLARAAVENKEIIQKRLYGEN